MNLPTGVDLDHPMVAPWLVRVWAALDSSGELLLHAGDQGFRSHTPLLFDTPDEAALHGVPVLLDLWGGLPVRAVASVSGSTVSLSVARVPQRASKMGRPVRVGSHT